MAGNAFLKSETEMKLDNYQNGSIHMPKINEGKFIEINEKYGEGVAVDIYGKEYSLVSARRNKAGEIWTEWCYPQKFEDGKRVPGEKSIPVRICFGLKEQAVQRLEQLIFMIEGR